MCEVSIPEHSKKRWCRAPAPALDAKKDAITFQQMDTDYYIAVRPHTPPPPPSRTKWTRLVPPSVLTGHVRTKPRAESTAIMSMKARGAARVRARGGA